MRAVDDLRSSNHQPFSSSPTPEKLMVELMVTVFSYKSNAMEKLIDCVHSK